MSCATVYHSASKAAAFLILVEMLTHFDIILFKTSAHGSRELPCLNGVIVAIRVANKLSYVTAKTDKNAPFQACQRFRHEPSHASNQCDVSSMRLDTAASIPQPRSLRLSGTWCTNSHRRRTANAVGRFFDHRQAARPCGSVKVPRRRFGRTPTKSPTQP